MSHRIHFDVMLEAAQVLKIIGIRSDLQRELIEAGQSLMKTEEYRGIDITSEDLISIGDAAKAFPGGCHLGTIWRYVLTGSNGVKLESVKAGGRRLTSAAAIRRFISATTAVSLEK